MTEPIMRLRKKLKYLTAEQVRLLDEKADEMIRSQLKKPAGHKRT